MLLERGREREVYGSDVQLLKLDLNAEIAPSTFVWSSDQFLNVLQYVVKNEKKI